MSRPTPCRPTTLSFGQAAIRLRVQFGLERNRMPSASLAAASIPASLVGVGHDHGGLRLQLLHPVRVNRPAEHDEWFHGPHYSGVTLTESSRRPAPRRRAPAAGMRAPGASCTADPAGTRRAPAGPRDAARDAPREGRPMHRVPALPARDTDRLRRGGCARAHRPGGRAARSRGGPGRPAIRGAGGPAAGPGARRCRARPLPALRHQRGQALQVEEGPERREATHPRAPGPERGRGASLRRRPPATAARIAHHAVRGREEETTR